MYMITGEKNTLNPQRSLWSCPIPLCPLMSIIQIKEVFTEQIQWTVFFADTGVEKQDSSWSSR